MNRKNLLWSGIITVAAVTLALPYIYYTIYLSVPGKYAMEFDRLVTSSLWQESMKLAVVVMLSCVIGFCWSEKIGLSGLGRLQDLQRNWQPILIFGAIIGILVYLLGDLHFIRLAPGFYPREVKYAIFIPFYAALVEEVFARFGVMTFFSRIFHSKQIGNVLAAVLFAVGHVNLLQVAGIIYRLNYVTLISFILNLIISLFFGYIYWRKGLVTAMGVHFVSNLRYVVIALFI